MPELNFDFVTNTNNSVFNRRDVSQYFSYKFTNDLRLGSLISNLLNPAFDLPKFERLVGWIGEDDYIDNNHFYKVSEATPDREHYQIAPFILSINENDEIISSIHYLDIFTNLKSQGAITSDINRLVNTENKSWCPPIDPDMLVNFLNYVWSPLGTRIYESHGKVYYNDTFKKSYESSVISTVSLNANKFRNVIDQTIRHIYEFKYSNNKWLLEQNEVRLSDYGISYTLIAGKDSPNENDKIVVEFIPVNTIEPSNITETLIGKEHAKVLVDSTHTALDDDPESPTYMEYITVQDEVEVQTGMRFRFYNDMNLDYNDIVYLVDGVGIAISLQDDREFGDVYELDTYADLENEEPVESTKIYAIKENNSLYKWGINEESNEYEWLNITKKIQDDASNPDYVTIQRQSKDFNDWSRTNRWFNIALVNNEFGYYYCKKATHQIIQFRKNKKLFNCGTQKILDVDCYYEGSVNLLFGQPIGYRIPSPDPEKPNPVIFNGMKILVKDTMSANNYEQVYEVSGMDIGISSLSLLDITFEENDEIYIKSGYREGLVYWKNNEFVNAQSKEDNVEPLFELYDENYYPLSLSQEGTFKGSKLFGFDNDYTRYKNYMYADLDGKKGFFYDYSTDSYETFLLDSTKNIKSDYIQYFYVMDENTTEYLLELLPYEIVSVSINTKQIDESKYSLIPPYISIRESLKVNDIIKVKFRTNELPTSELQNAFLEVSKVITTTPANEEIVDIDYNVLLSQMIDIISNQDDIQGNPYSQNNYSSTKQDISVGTKLFNTYSRFNKVAIINNIDGVNVKSAILKIAEKYEEFKRRFVQRIEQMSNTDEFTEFSEITYVVKSAIAFINQGKLQPDPFYNNGVISDDSYIPATPAYLGMIPCVKPRVEGRTLIGHDGSETYLKFGDWRDNALIELENEIYDSINPDFKNSVGKLEIQKFIPGYKKETDYTYAEYISLLEGIFSKWFNFNTNETFTNINYSDDPFTWNWSSCKDFNGNNLLGHYRGIYNYFYGTYRPDTCPWEMLGFYEKPAWWDKTYGEAPYTSNNLVMWQDIADGIIRGGKNAGQYDYLKRDYLLDIIPTDEEGNLLPPNLNGITNQTPLYINAKESFKFGDGSDAEYDWWMTSEFKYALMCVVYLMKPGFWLEYTWDMLESKENYKLSDKIHNLLVDGEYQKVIGSAQWISDFLLLNGIEINTLAELLRNIQVKLGYRVGAYLDSGNLEIKNVKQEVLLSNNYKTITYKSAYIKSISISTMHIAWVDGKYIIYGNDINEPYFHVETPITTTNYTYDKSTPLNIFYFKSWKDEGEKIQYYSVVNSVQEVYNIIRGYGKYLISQGFIYQNYDTTSQLVVDWDTMAKNFLSWVVSTERQDRDVLTLTPWNIINIETGYPHSYVSYKNEYGIIDNICAYTNNVWNVLDIDGNALLSEDIDVYRQPNGVVIKTKDMKQIGYLHLNIYTQENAIIFDNVQDNNYIMYDSINGEFITNLYIESVRTEVWDGGLYAPGLILNDNKLIYNYSKRAYDFKDYYNIDSITSVQPLGIIAKSVTGYKQNVLLNSIFTNENAEFDFYNSEKFDKGSYNVIKALRRLPNMKKLEVFEIFALLEDEYGSFDNYKMWEILCQDNWKANNPQIFNIHTYKSYKQYMDVIDEPVIANDVFYAAKSTSTIDHRQMTGYIKIKDLFSPLGFNWNLKIAIAIDDLLLGQDRTILYCNNPKIPSLYSDNYKIYLQLDGEKILSFNIKYPKQKYFVEYGWNGEAYYLKWSTDNKVFEEVTYPVAERDEETVSIKDAELYIGMNINENTEKPWLEGRIFLQEYKNSLVENKNNFIQRNVNNVYFDSPEWIKQADFNSDNRFRKIVDESKYTFLPYIPLLREDEVQYKTETKGNLENLLINNDVKTTDKILVTFDNDSWDLLQLKVVNHIDKIEYADEVDIFDNVAIFKTTTPHNFEEGDMIVIRSGREDNESWDGVQTILKVIDNYHFTITTTVQKADDCVGTKPEILTTISRKYTNKSDLIVSQDIDEYTLKSSVISPEAGDIFYVEENEEQTHNIDALYIVKNNGKARLLRKKESKVDTKLIQQFLIYDKKNPLSYTKYDIFDPYKYCVDLDVQKNIRYINYSDPAVYNIDTVTEVESFNDNWNNSHVGEVWWDISKCKYFDYEIEDDEYRSKMWGKMVLGSEIRIYEWVKSPVNPADYVSAVEEDVEVDGNKLSGKPYFHIVDGTEVYPYNTKLEYNEEDRADKLWYYFWVENTQYVPNCINRTLSTSSMALRLNVDMNKTYWMSPISLKLNSDLTYSSSFIISNSDTLTNNDNVLQLKYELKENEFPLHKDWLYYHKGITETKYLYQWNKFKDSLAGYDTEWREVPNIVLNEYNRYSNRKQPRQSIYVDRKAALKNLIQKTNDMLLEHNLDSNVIDKFSIQNKLLVKVTEDYLFNDISADDIYFVFKIIQEEPNEFYEVLPVDDYKKVETNNSTDIRTWTFVDAEESEYITFDGSEIISKPNYIVETYNDLQTLLLENYIEPGKTIYVNNDITHNNDWILYRVNELEDLVVEKQQLYKMSDYYDYVDWYSPNVDNFNVIVKTYDYLTELIPETDLYAEGDLVKINHGNDNDWIIMKLDEGTWKTVAVENGTIQINNKILDIDISDTLSQESKLFALVVRNILKLYED